jgi:hypothetical protein
MVCLVSNLSESNLSHQTDHTFVTRNI